MTFAAPQILPQILVVEDEPRIRALLKQGLEQHGFKVTLIADGQSAIHLANRPTFDLMILDLNLPDYHGLEVLRVIRQRGETLPVIILTVLDDLKHKVQGLEGGADDYVTKPFQIQELVARIRVRLRQPVSGVVQNETDFLLTAGELRLDLRKRQAQFRHQRIELSTREFSLLAMLIRRAGEAISRDELLNEVWGQDYNATSNIVDVYIGYLRKKIGGRQIETVRGVGYRLRI